MANKKTSKGAAHTSGTAQTPTDAAAQQPQMVESAVRQVSSLKEFKEVSEELRGEGYFEVPGALGGGRGNGPKADYGEYINSKLACDEGGKQGRGVFPLLHVSSGSAVHVKTANGHEGNYITWGWGNKLPNVVSFFCSLSPYTAAALKFNIDLTVGKGPQPMYQYTQYIGGNITTKRIPFSQAGVLIKGWIRDLKRELTKLEAEHPELTDDDGAAGFSPVQTTPTPPNLGGETDTSAAGGHKSAAEQMRDDINEQIAGLEKDYEVWDKSNKAFYGDPDAATPDERIGFDGRNNLTATFQQLLSDFQQFNLCFPEFELQETYIDPQTGHDVKSFKWHPQIVGLKWRNAKTMRLGQMNNKNQNRIEHVYISNQWLSSPDSTVPTQDGDFKIDALPALSAQSPTADLERITRDARTANVAKKRRPTHVVMPVTYNEYGHPYYPVPAWYSVFSGDVYTYASLLISDRKKRRDNANVIGRILYVSDEYVQRMYIQRHLDTPEQRREFFNEEIVKPINNFLKNRDHMGEPMLAYTFKDSDGKTYKSWEIVEVVDNDKSTAEANKEELAEISSIILFAWGVDSQLIGNTPGTTTRSGGTDLRERYLLKQVQSATMQSLILRTLDVVRQYNQWDPHMVFEIQREVLTTLDNSKTGITSAEET